MNKQVSHHLNSVLSNGMPSEHCDPGTTASKRRWHVVALEKQSQEDQELEASLDCIAGDTERPCLKERRKRRRRR